MKQLKFFTCQSDTMQSAKAALASLGISPNKMRVFARENAQHRFDGLVLQSTQNKEEASVDQSTALYALVGLCGAMTIYAKWLSFVEFFALVLLVSVCVGAAKLFLKKSPKQLTLANQVYFFVVDVDDDKEESVSNIAKSCPGLIAQV
ncbi:hypothetical protein TDB9533_01547 [Thalassocella blandensis]|nr:hypothetical protein TDB9533_01547 [Thalassocella blandensis]